MYHGWFAPRTLSPPLRVPTHLRSSGPMATVLMSRRHPPWAPSCAAFAGGMSVNSTAPCWPGHGPLGPDPATRTIHSTICETVAERPLLELVHHDFFPVHDRDAGAARREPYSVLGVERDLKDEVARQPISRREVGEGLAVEPAEAAKRTDPQGAMPVEGDIANVVADQSVVLAVYLPAVAVEYAEAAFLGPRRDP